MLLNEFLKASPAHAAATIDSSSKSWLTCFQHEYPVKCKCLSFKRATGMSQSSGPIFSRTAWLVSQRVTLTTQGAPTAARRSVIEGDVVTHAGQHHSGQNDSRRLAFLRFIALLLHADVLARVYEQRLVLPLLVAAHGPTVDPFATLRLLYEFLLQFQLP